MWTEYDTFRVHIRANVFDGRSFDYRVASYTVYKGIDGVETEQDAIDWVNNNKLQVLAELDVCRSGTDSNRRTYKSPIEKNVFFAGEYYVTASKSNRSDSARACSNFITHYYNLAKASPIQYPEHSIT